MFFFFPPAALPCEPCLYLKMIIGWRSGVEGSGGVARVKRGYDGVMEWMSNCVSESG